MVIEMQRNEGHETADAVSAAVGKCYVRESVCRGSNTMRDDNVEGHF